MDQIGQILYALFRILIILFGLPGNVLVMYLFIKFTKLQTITNRYITNMAAGNICYLICIPLDIFLMSQEWNWEFGNLGCRGYYFLQYINMFTSGIFICIMSADRFFALYCPTFCQKWRTPFTSKMVSWLVWTTSILLIIPLLYYAEVEKYRQICILYWYNGHIYMFVCSFAVPLGLALIFCCLLKLITSENQSEEKKVTDLILTITGVYIICWTPYWILLILINSSLIQVNQYIHIMFQIALITRETPMVINPILFAFFNDNLNIKFLKAANKNSRQNECEIGLTANPSSSTANVIPVEVDMESQPANM